MKKFVKPDLEWLNFVVDNRKGLYKGTCYDIVFGPVANEIGRASCRERVCQYV